MGQHRRCEVWNCSPLDHCHDVTYLYSGARNCAATEAHIRRTTSENPQYNCIVVTGLYDQCRLYALSCQAVAKFCRDYKSRTVSAGRDCSFVIALPWGHINIPVEFVTLQC